MKGRRRVGVLAVLAIGLLLLAGSAAGAPGALDPGFGASGVVTTFLSTEGSFANALVVQPGGEIVAVGEVVSPVGGSEQIGLARYEPNGSLDTSFGSGGVVLTSNSVVQGATGQCGFHPSGAAAVLQPDGKIVVAATTEPCEATIGSLEIAVLRYNPDGSLDTGFGNGGVVGTSLACFAEAKAILLQPDGKIVVGGDGEANSASGCGSNASLLVRLMPDGYSDSSFGSGGSVLTPGSGSGFNALALQPGGKIVGAGNGVPLTRYNPDGSIDISFGSGGVSGAPVPSTSALALQPDGKIVAAGQASDGSRNVFALARVDSDGSADATFGSSGSVTTAIGDGNATASAVALQPDGKIVAAGTSQGSAGQVFTLARYTADGFLDSTFGSGGVVTTLAPSWTSASAAALALQSDGKIDVAGQATLNGWAVPQVALARYLVSSTLTISAGGDGSGSVVSTPAGIDCGSTCSASFAPGPVTLTETPAAGSFFAGWSGACSGTGTCAVTLNADTSVTATFSRIPETLTVRKTGKGHGTITSSPAGIGCGSHCSRAYGYGTTVTLVARPASGSAFKGWYGSCSGTRPCKLTMKQTHTAIATFQFVCIVPRLKGASLRVARHRIERAHCRTGRITHRYSKAEAGRVIYQKPPHGRHLRNGAKVKLVVSKGRRR